MERAQFVKLSTAALEHIEERIADLEHESLDVELAGDVLTLEFADGVKFVINAHSAAGQIWMAANRNAWHFDPVVGPDEGQPRWIAHKTGDELMQTVSAVVGDKLGINVTL